MTRNFSMHDNAQLVVAAIEILGNPGSKILFQERNIFYSRRTLRQLYSERLQVFLGMLKYLLLPSRSSHGQLASLNPRCSKSDKSAFLGHPVQGSFGDEDWLHSTKPLSTTLGLMAFSYGFVLSNASHV